MSATRPAPDPIVQEKPGTAGGSVHNASEGRVKSISGGGPNFTKDPGKGGLPVPNSPYGKG